MTAQLSLIATTPPAMTGDAVFSPCTRYRFRLWREWGDASSRCLFVMLNPSTATAEVDDPTIRRCVGYAKRWGFGALDVANIFALRSTDPEALYAEADPVGAGNDEAIVELARCASRVVLAWGAHGAYQGRGSAVLRLLAGVPCVALGVTQSGQPRHPLYLRSDAGIVAVQT